MAAKQNVFRRPVYLLEIKAEIGPHLENPASR
jgi:hypothetical protein